MRLLLLPALLSLAALADAQSKPEIDNPWVRVSRLKLAPREKTPPTPRLDSVVVYVAGPRTGDIAWFDAGQHTEVNASDRPLEAVVTELKSPTTDQRQPVVTLDPVKLDHEHHLVPFENGRVRVLRTILEPHVKSPMHEHPHYVVVYLTELHTTMVLGDGKAVDNVRHPGEIAWRDFMKHETENLGDRTAVEIQIELK